MATGVAPASKGDGDYPRPALVRQHHVSLDRACGFAYDDGDVGRAERWFTREEVFTRTIRLPFAPESSASGIGDTGYHPVVWYRIVVSDLDLRTAGWREQGDVVRLHFGAVDYCADVWVNGTHVARHRGGHTAFTADITDALEVGASEHVVVVRAQDDPLDARTPRGKQDWHLDPHGIWYHRTTGIWRTVWIEAVPLMHIRALAWSADLAAGSVRLEFELSRRPADPVGVHVGLTYEDLDVARGSVVVRESHGSVTLALAGLGNAQAQQDVSWSPEHPRLLDAVVALDAPGHDTVGSYIGLRSVGVEAGRFTLNGRPYYLRSVLEQGFWPRSHFTAPDHAALRAEVELIKALGFNAVRIHQKVEDPRFLYWCDRLGVAVWAEMANAYQFDDIAAQRLVGEWIEVVRQYRAHPSIVTWVPLNESWGVQHCGHDPAQRALIRAMADLTRALDPTRPVVSNDGWEHANSDIVTIHDYEPSGDVLEERYGSGQAIGDLTSGFGPAGRRVHLSPPGDELPVMLTEFGGISFAFGQVPEDSWGYSRANDAEAFASQLAEVLDAVQSSDHLGGFCYTQLTDTLQEINGLCDAERQPKLPVEEIARIVRGEA